MDFKNFLLDFVSSSVIIFRRYLNLIFTPYKTMRKISLEKDLMQVYIILGSIVLYFSFRSFWIKLQFPFFLYILIFILDFAFTILFFYLIGSLFSKETSPRSLIFTLSYALYPTLTWFLANSIFYLLIPPPRTFSLLGRVFSIFFMTFSISLLFWKIILFYLAIRFSTKLNFFSILYLIILYALFLIPIIYGMYILGLSKVPFI